VTGQLSTRKPLQFKPHAALVSLRIRNQLGNFGMDVYETFKEATQAAMRTLNTAIMNEGDMLMSDRLNKQMTLEMTVQGFVTSLIAAREQIEMNLGMFQDE
jgi:hypothetical protein